MWRYVRRLLEVPSIAAAVQVATRFYSAAGHTSIVRMIVVTAAVRAILWVCGYIDWTYGLALNGLVGAVAGAALAKFGVEAARGTRDAGIDLHLAAWGVLALGGAMVAAVFAATESSTLPTPVPMRIAYGVIAAAAVALLWPPRRRADATAERLHTSAPDRRGPRFALACIAGVMGLMLFYAWFSIGMDEANKRAMRYTAEHQHECGQP